MSTTSVAPVLSGAWWEAALWRALRTVIVVAIPYLGGGTVAGIPWATVGGAVALAGVASLATSLFGLAELSGTSVPVWQALLERTVKTFGQAIAAGIGSAALFGEVHWVVVLQAAAIAAVGSLFTGVLGFLPEAGDAAAVLQGKPVVLPVVNGGQLVPPSVPSVGTASISAGGIASSAQINVAAAVDPASIAASVNASAAK